MGFEIHNSSVPRDARHVQVHVENGMSATSRHVQVRSQVVGSQVPAVYIDVLEAL